MQRDIDIDEISDGKRYHANDMVKINCNDCKGCIDCCCQNMGKTIILDPYDIYQLTSGLTTTFDELMTGDEPAIELSMADGLLLPNLRMHSTRNCCVYLGADNRCTIHNLRSGFCRMFPLGRIYEDGSFSYFNQIYECDYPNKSKVKVKKWIGIPNLAQYEEFALKWHDFIEGIRENIKSISDINEVSKLTVGFLNTFYRTAYRPDESIYDQIYSRMEEFGNNSVI